MTDRLTRERIAGLLEGTTPGPWRLDADRDVVSGDGAVASPFWPDNFDTWPTWEQRNADARLIAAAPALAETALALMDEVARLTQCLDIANKNHEHFEREWYLCKDSTEAEVAALKAENERLREALELIKAEALFNKGPEEDALNAILFFTRSALTGEKP